MKTPFLFFGLILMCGLPLNALSQGSDTVFVDLGDDNYKGQQIDLDTKTFVMINKKKRINYKISWQKTRRDNTAFSIDALRGGGQAAADTSCSNEDVEDIIDGLVNAKNEKEVKEFVTKANQILPTLPDGLCKTDLLKEISYTRAPLDFPYGGRLSYNDVITLTVERLGLDEKLIDTRTYVFKTPERDRWLIHYGLTYAPSAISRFSKYYALADTSATNKYTIKKENKNGPKPWDNISATINFTYPFHGDSRDFDGGFTGGFGLSTGFEVSGHAGLSMIIGQNIILSSGVVMMQKHKLNGEYKEGDIVKTNLNFEALHTKVWVPELFFTIGFRFGSNPFAAKKTNSEAKKEE